MEAKKFCFYDLERWLGIREEKKKKSSERDSECDCGKVLSEEPKRKRQ